MSFSETIRPIVTNLVANCKASDPVAIRREVNAKQPDWLTAEWMQRAWQNEVNRQVKIQPNAGRQMELGLENTDVDFD